MQSWTDALSGMEPVFRSSNPRVKIFKVNTEGPLGEVIVKQIACAEKEELEKAMNEGSFAMANPYPHICECLCYWQEEQPEGGFYVYILMPCLPGTLQDDIKRRSQQIPPKYYAEEELWTYLRDLVDAFAFLQVKNITHRDIKPHNLLLRAQKDIVICDFGFAKRIGEDGVALHTLLGTVPFFSPKLRSAFVRGEREILKVQHNVFKSDVYSLGVTMLILTLLEEPPFIMTLRNLQHNIDMRLSDISMYSVEWVATLRRMLLVEEDGRPDFLRLREELARTPEFADDEAIVAEVCSVMNDPLEISLRCGLSYARVSLTRFEDVPCVITLKTREQDPCARLYSADFVCAIDVSGSMNGDRLALLQVALEQFLCFLGPRDRMCIVTFSDRAVRECALTACTDEGKQKLLRCIGDLCTGDLTNITAGFTLAMEVIQQRTVQNASTSLLLFTDGIHNFGEDPSDACLSMLRMKRDEKLSVHCFGFGTSLDTKLLETLAAEGNGLFYHIVDESSIPAAFQAAFKNVASVVARHIRVELRENTGALCSIANVYSKDSSSVFSLPDITSNTQKDMVFLLRTKYASIERPVRTSPISVTVTYVDNEMVQSRKAIELGMKFSQWVTPQPTKDGSVFAHWYRVRGAVCLREARKFAENKQFREADRCLSNGVEDIESGGFSHYPMVAAVLRDMQDARRLVQSNTSWERGGESHFASVSYSHYSQNVTAIWSREHVNDRQTDELKTISEDESTYEGFTDTTAGSIKRI